MANDELCWMSAAALAAAIRRRKLSPVEVMRAVLDRIERVNPRLNALVTLTADQALKDARAAERALGKKGARLGPLHGVPFSTKDLVVTKGIRTTFGTRFFADNVPAEDAPMVERLKAAGAIQLGKTNTPTFGWIGATHNLLFGVTRNPWNTDRTPGGSSGGASAAVAAGLGPIAIGTDGGGSIRIPASWCGVYGYKQSFGRVPFVARPNAFAGGAPFLFEGPITRTVEDAALALTALAGYDSRDPHSLDEQVDFTAATRRSIRGWKIAYSPNFDVFPMDRRVTDVVGSAVRAFEEAGAHVEEIKVGIERPQKELSDTWCRLIMPLNVQTFEIMKRAGVDLLKDHRDDFPPQYLRWLDVGYRMSALDFFKDQEIRSEIYDAIQGVLNRYDLLITPTLACLPVDNADDNNTMGPTAINGEEVDPLIGWCLTYFINFSGHPAASIPAGLSSDNLPVGMQIIGRRYADADVLAASAVFERLRPWQESYRICAGRAI
jgi:amidase